MRETPIITEEILDRALIASWHAPIPEGTRLDLDRETLRFILTAVDRELVEQARKAADK